jgi:hypothetical protein
MIELIKHISLIWVLISMSGAALAASPTAPQVVQITSVGGSLSAANGYLLVTTSVAVQGCEAGFWMPSGDSSYAAILASAKQALGLQLSVTVSGDRDQRWPDSDEKYCRIVQFR